MKVNYVAFYPLDLLHDYLMMGTLERGVFWSLCSKLYAEGGRLPNNTALLASISGLSEPDFGRCWTAIKHKFVQEGDFILQKRCTIELKKADRLIQQKRKAGLASAKMRKMGDLKDTIKTQQRSNDVATAVQLRDETRPRVEKNNTNTSNSLKESLAKIEKQMLSTNSNSFLNSSSPSDSSREADKLALYQALIQFFDIRNNGDRTCIDNICKWAVNHVLASQWKNDFYKKIIDLAQEAKTNAKRNRWGYFLDALRREFGYVPPSKV